MRKKIDKIEIQEPPIEKFTKKRSCMRKSCFTGCGCLVLLLITSLVILKFTLGPKTRELKDLPQGFVDSIPLYDEGGIEKISITEGRNRNKGAEYIAFLPKLFISPIIIVLDGDNSFIRYNKPPDDSGGKIRNLWNKFISFLKTPVADHRDIYNIEWAEHDADADFIENYYKVQLNKEGFSVEDVSKSGTITQFTFSKKNIDGILYIKDRADTPRTDMVLLTITVDLKQK